MLCDRFWLRSAICLSKWNVSDSFDPKGEDRLNQNCVTQPSFSLDRSDIKTCVDISVDRLLDKISIHCFQNLYYFYH